MIYCQRISIIGVVILMVLGGFPLMASEFQQYLDNQKAIQYYEQEDYESATQKIAEALSKGDPAGELYNNLGNILYKQQQWDQAASAYGEALNHLNDDKKALAYYNLGNTFYQKKDLSNSKKFYEQALNLNPSDLDAKMNLERVLIQMEQQPTQNQTQKDDKNEESEPKKDSQNQQQKVEQKQAEDKRKQAENILKGLDQKEKEARQKYIQQQTIIQDEVEIDW